MPTRTPGRMTDARRNQIAEVCERGPLIHSDVGEMIMEMDRARAAELVLLDRVEYLDGEIDQLRAIVGLFQRELPKHAARTAALVEEIRELRAQVRARTKEHEEAT